mmetsp:Transcript_17740/g.45645  ORF Transcript_17740/g.45645 Transcript_17740/m.45645 type:complete len:548 (-) Transcript_17740:301-1944(-)
MFQAFVLFVGLIILLGLRYAVRQHVKGGRKAGRDPFGSLPWIGRLCLQYYFWLYVICYYEMYRQWQYIYRLIQDWDILNTDTSEKYNTLYEAHLNETGIQGAHALHPTKWPATVEEWREETAMPGWLVMFGMSAYVASFICVTACVVHTILHVSAEMDDHPEKPGSKRLPITLMKSRDYAVMVVALPAVYAAMAGKSIIRAISLMSGEFLDSNWDGELTTWFERVQLEMNIYEANYKVAEIYEAWALLVFGRLCAHFVIDLRSDEFWQNMDYVHDVLKAKSGYGQPELKVQERQVVGADGAVLRVEQQAPEAGMAISKNAPKFSEHLHAGEKEGKVQETTMTVDYVLSSGTPGLKMKLKAERTIMGKLLTFGITVFAVCNAAVATYQILLGLLPQAPFQYNICAEKPAFCSLGLLWQGCNLVASCVAITNILMFETKMHHDLEQINPGAKFWGVKLLVMISFWQTIVVHVMPVVKDFSEFQRNLFVSALLCWEVMFVSFMHFHAWDHRAKWYDVDHTYAEKEKEMRQLLLRGATRRVGGPLEEPLLA